MTKAVFRWLAALCVMALALGLLWNAGALQWLALRLEPKAAVMADKPAPLPTATPQPTPQPTQEPTPQPTPAPTPEPTPAPTPAAGSDTPPVPSIQNGTSSTPDFAALLREGWNGALSADGPQILILHSHGCEAYTPAGTDSYEASEPFRTLDKSQSVVRVGDALASALEARGYSVLHDREAYDAAGYSGAYGRSLAAAEAWLEAYPTLRVVLDVHRDSLNGHATLCEADGGRSAQVMLLAATGEAGLYHPNWRENLKLALELQAAMERQTPGLARPLYLSPARYNQHLSPGSLILEVGSDANTLAEAVLAAERFAESAAAVLDAHLVS